MLTVNQPKTLKGLYIDDKGFVSSYSFIIDYYVNAIDYDDTSLWNKLFSDFEKSILILRGYSNYQIFTAHELKTDNIHIKYTNSKLNPWSLDVPAFGSPRECIELNLKSYISVFLSERKIGHSVYCTVKATEDVLTDQNTILFNLRTIDVDGIASKSYKLTYEFEADRNPTCGTCLTGLSSFRTNILQLGTTLINIPDPDHVVTGQIVTDVDVKNTESILNTIKKTLTPVISMAKIINLKLEEV